MRKVFSRDAIKGRVKKFLTIKKEMMENVGELHVKLQRGNKKIGANVWSVSLLPVIDCKNCAECKWDCYDLKNDLIYTQIINDRCRNSVIHSVDIERYWSEIDMQVKANFVTDLRLNIGGDLLEDDFPYVKKLGEDNSKTKILFFTKNYKGINAFLENDSFPENVHPIMSAWCGVKMENPFNLPVAHVLYEDGTTTAPEYGAYLCTGNCSECSFEEKGCWTLKQGESVVFVAH